MGETIFWLCLLSYIWCLESIKGAFQMYKQIQLKPDQDVVNMFDTVLKGDSAFARVVCVCIMAIEIILLIIKCYMVYYLCNMNLLPSHWEHILTWLMIWYAGMELINIAYINGNMYKTAKNYTVESENFVLSVTEVINNHGARLTTALTAYCNTFIAILITIIYSSIFYGF